MLLWLWLTLVWRKLTDSPSWALTRGLVWGDRRSPGTQTAERAPEPPGGMGLVPSLSSTAPARSLSLLPEGVPSTRFASPSAHVLCPFSGWIPGSSPADARGSAAASRLQTRPAAAFSHLPLVCPSPHSTLFCREKCLIWTKSNLSAFPSMDCSFGIKCNNVLPRRF